jgi:hypothetical protein
MAIKQTGQKWNPILVTTKRKFIIDNEQDVVDLPTCCPGSYALCVDGGIVYMVNASGEWKKMGAAALSVAEGVLF